MSRANTSLLGFDPSDQLPRAPEVGKTDKDTIANLVEFCNKLIAAQANILSMYNTIAKIGFQSWTDGATTYYANDSDAMDLSSLVSNTIDFDVPLMSGITWSVDSGVPKWTSGTISYAW